MAYALITGASGGIGLELAEELAKRKIDLLLLARSEGKLKEICNRLVSTYQIKADYLSIDLSASDAIAKIESWLASNSFDVNILINNAGYGIWGRVDSTSVENLNNMMQLNMNVVANLCHALIPQLKKHNQSYILNVASTAAYQAVPTLTTYAATKAFVVLFTRGLRLELKDTPISVTCLSPGATSTNFIDRAGMESLKEKAEKFSMSAKEVAQIAIKGMFDKKAEVLPGFINWISVQLTYLMPKFIPERIAAGLYK
jgi:uncharacterized protein